MGSSLTMTALVALLLNLVFRIGISRHRTLALLPSPEASQAIFDFMQTNGGAWGARPDVIRAATAAMTEFMETAAVLTLAQGVVHMHASFDEFRLDVRIKWQGKPINLTSQRPNVDFETMDDRVFIDLSGYLIRTYASSFEVSQNQEEQELLLHFDH
jgi:NCS2 family nucleobase:cation symporter-2